VSQKPNNYGTKIIISVKAKAHYIVSVHVYCDKERVSENLTKFYVSTARSKFYLVSGTFEPKRYRRELVDLCCSYSSASVYRETAYIQGVPKRCIHKANIPYYNVYTTFWDTLYVGTMNKLCQYFDSHDHKDKMLLCNSEF
jgi:hypothetical protein